MLLHRVTSKKTVHVLDFGDVTNKKDWQLVLCGPSDFFIVICIDVDSVQRILSSFGSSVVLHVQDHCSYSP
jgi:hypothetical protein